MCVSMCCFVCVYVSLVIKVCVCVCVCVCVHPQWVIKVCVCVCVCVCVSLPTLLYNVFFFFSFLFVAQKGCILFYLPPSFLCDPEKLQRTRSCGIDIF